MKVNLAGQCIGAPLLRKGNLERKLNIKPKLDTTHLLEDIYRPSFQADCASYAFLLRACTGAKALRRGHLIHDHIVKTGLEHNAFLTNLIIDMYGHCDGSFPVASFMFTKMAHPDIFSWNFIIRAYTHSGLYIEALGLFQSMLGQSLIPDQYIYVSVLTVCASIKSLTHGKQLHVHLTWNNFESEPIMATALINMYGKCGSMIDAWAIFDKVALRDVTLWNTMIATCANYGYVKIAFQLVRQLHEECGLPDKDLILTTLDACGEHNVFLEGKHFHARIAGLDVDIDVIVQTALSNMYVKCSNSVKNVQIMPFTTTGLQSPLQGIQLTYTGHVPRSMALEHFKSDGVLPDKYILANIISACASKSAFLEGEHVHTCIAGTRMEFDVVVGAALISLYGKSGKLSEARILFDRMPIHDVVSWTAMISAYTQNGESREALLLFKQMKLKGIQPNKMTYATVFDACTLEDCLTEGRHVHQEIANSELESNVFVGTALVNMYGRFGCLEDAGIAFDKMVDHDVAAWNASISASVHNKEGVRALQYFRQMQEECVVPNKVTLVSGLNACATHSALSEGKHIHAQVVILDLDSDIVVATALIHTYGRCKCINNAKSIFDVILNRDTVLWTAMMAAYAHCGQIIEAFKLFDEMLVVGALPDKISCISILSACVSKTGINDGRQMHTRMIFCGLDLDESTLNGLITMYMKCGSMDDALKTFEIALRRNRDMYVSILSACANKFHLVKGRRIHRQIVEIGFEFEVPVGNAIINMYSKCGSLQEARIVFEKMPERDIVSWTVMITSHAQHGQGDYALHLFDRMQMKGHFPNKVTFVNILNAFTHAGMVDEGFQYLGHVCQTQNTVSPIVDHYNILVDLLGKAGRLSEAEDMIKKMPCPATACTWTTLLDACRQHKDVERGERAADKLLRIKPSDLAPYITIFNMYTSVGRSSDAAQVMYRLKEKESIIKKGVG